MSCLPDLESMSIRHTETQHSCSVVTCIHNIVQLHVMYEAEIFATNVKSRGFVLQVWLKKIHNC